MPGSTNLPVASMTRALAEAFRFLPTAAILPLRMSTSVFGSVPRVTVRTVALRISVSVGPTVCAWTTDPSNTTTNRRSIFFIICVSSVWTHAGCRKSSRRHADDRDGAANLVCGKRSGERGFFCLSLDLERNSKPDFFGSHGRVRDLAGAERAGDRARQTIRFLLQRERCGLLVRA